MWQACSQTQRLPQVMDGFFLVSETSGRNTELLLILCGVKPMSLPVALMAAALHKDGQS